MVDISRIILNQAFCSSYFYNVIPMFKVSENAMPCKTRFARCCFSRNHIMFLVLEDGQLYWWDIIGCTFIFGVGLLQFRHWLWRNYAHPTCSCYCNSDTSTGVREVGGKVGSIGHRRNDSLVYLFLLLIKLPDNYIGKLITGRQINTLAR